MERLTFEGNFCDIAQCESVPGGSYCENGNCSQREVWERLKAYEDAGLSPAACAEARWVKHILNDNGCSEEQAVDLLVAFVEGRVVILPNSEARPVVRDDGQVYASIAQAAVDNGTARSKISAVCNGKRKSVKCHTFRPLPRET